MIGRQDPEEKLEAKVRGQILFRLLKEAGFTYTGHNYGSFLIMAKGNYRMHYDPKTINIMREYEVQEIQ